jgi:Flp pilus assembly pilin Flp
MGKLSIGIYNLLSRLKSECGQDSVEYAIMIGIVALATIASVGTISNYVSSTFNGYSNTL